MPASKDSKKKGPTPRRTTRIVPEPVTYNPDDKYRPTTWGGALEKDLELPSGQLCRARRAGLEGLLRAGIIHDIDPLMPLIHAHENRVKGKKTQSEDEMLQEVVKDPAKIESVLHMVDRVVCHVTIAPIVKMTPNDITNRVSGQVYADMVDLEDKMYIFNWVLGGADDVAQFREELSGRMASLSDGEADGSQAE